MNTINSQITKAIVYRNGAKISHNAKIELIAGKQEIILDNLTDSIAQDSLQVIISGKAMLLSASVQHSFADYKIIPEKSKVLEELLQQTINEIEWLESEQDIYQGEESLIHDNQKLTNEKNKVSAEDIEKLADFYQSRLFELRKKTHDNTLKIRDLENKKNHIEQQIQNIQGQPGRQIGQVVLNLSANERTSIEIEFTYLTSSASWTPSYDIRSDSSENEIELFYKANVEQSTGYDWNDIQLIISTGNPTGNNEHPVLFPWHIDFYKPKPRHSDSFNKKAMAASESIMDEGEWDNANKMRKIQSLPYEVTQVESQMATEFQIETKQDIPSDGKQHIVPICIYNLPVLFKHYVAPKLEQQAFLLAQIKEYNLLDLLPGDTNVFYEGMYIGQVYFNTRSTSEMLEVSMGKDERVGVQRNQITNETSRKIISSAQKEIKGYEITLRNNKKRKIELDVFDQIPISNHNEIVVEIEESNGAEHRSESGILFWNVSLEPGETKKIRFVYSVKYPKDKEISGL